jgi:hypothetical protein
VSDILRILEETAHVAKGNGQVVLPDDLDGAWSDGSKDLSLIDTLPLEDPEPASVNGRAPASWIVPISSIEMRSILWLERPLWQRSAFELLAGAKGSGKGTYTAHLAARVSRGDLPGGPQNVVFVSSEDSAEIDLKPRLVAAGADTDKVFVIQRSVRLPDNIDVFRQIASELGGIGLLIIDPVANHIGNTRGNDDTEVRFAIAPLNQLADDLDALVIGVRHPGKDRSRGALASVLGSTAWIDTPRAVVMLATDDQDDTLRHIQVVAGNRSINGRGQTFRIDAVDIPGLAEPITVAVPLGESSKNVDDLLGSRSRQETKTATARELILDILEDEGEQESDALDARVARQTGLAAQTIRNTRVALGKEGLTKAVPDKDEYGSVSRWQISRTAAPR